jgi:hypothetical protein
MLRYPISELFDDLVVGFVGTDPEPFDGIVFQNTKGTPLAADANGIYRNAFTDTDFLEVETVMIGVATPDKV